MRIETLDPFSRRNAQEKAKEDKVIREQSQKHSQAIRDLEAKNRIRQREIQITSDKPHPWPKKFYNP